MAKITEPMTSNPLWALLQKSASIRDTDGQITARQKQVPAQTWIDQNIGQAANSAACRAGWDELAGWKRYRWSVCAWVNGIPGTSPPPNQRWAGFALYTKCWIDQQVEAGKQPISPCSRRVTDPDASPWDYTP